MKTKRTKRTYTAEERKQYAEAQRQQATEKLEEALDLMRSEDGFERWLRARSLFHNYSWTNSLLIVLQMPTATRAASYKTWQKLNRQVRKGEKGLWIRVPTPIILRDPETGKPRLGDDGKPLKRMAFKGGYTFDVSQTEGEPLPEGPSVEPLTGDSHEWAIEPLVKLAESMDLTVEFRDLSDRPEGGWHNGVTGEIVVDSSESPNMRAHVLMHEIAHAMGVSYTDFPRPEAEVIVEAAAYIASQVIGLDTGGFAVGYIAGWAGTDYDSLKRVGAKIDETSKRLTAALDREHNGAEAEAAVTA